MEDNELIAQWARDGAAKSNGKHGPMCNDCAFRTGSDANSNDPAAVATALDCVVYEQAKFHCHTKDLKDAGKPCAGYLYARERWNISNEIFERETGQ